MGRSLTLFGSNQFNNNRQLAIRDSRNEIKKESPNVILGTTAEEYAEAIVDKYGIDPVSIDYDNAKLDRRSSPREPLWIFLPAAGNLELLRYKPRAPYQRIERYRAEIVENGYRIRIERSRRGRSTEHEQIEADIKEAIDTIEQQHGILQEMIEEFHDELREGTKRMYKKREKEINRERETLEKIDFPVRERDEVPDVLDIEPPEKREVIDIEELRNPSDPIWRIPDAAYFEILETLNDLGNAFQRSPDLFDGFGEEDLRDLMLFFIEQHFIGTTTGETFNKRGKTDIMLQSENEPVFVAECAIWKGPKTLTDKISQLIDDYLTWRDSKAAIILFVQRKRFDPILEKIPTTVEEHPGYLESREQEDASWWQYRFELPDSGGEIDLGVQAYYIPTL